MRMDCSIVIVTYNSRAPVERCLASLAAHPPSAAVETIVVDNASADGTPALVRERFPSVRLVENAGNVGYSRAVNQGIRLAAGRFVLILNPDIVVRPGSIDALIDFMERTPDAGIAGAKLVYADGSLQYSARSFYTIGSLVYRRTVLGRLFPRAKPLRRHLLLDDPHESTRVVDWVIGACMMVRREALERVGAMDERFFLYFEDIDWCFRMGKQGWKVYYVPASVMTHTYERSSAKSMLRKPFVFHALSLLRYAEKWNRFFYFFRRHRGAVKTATLAASDVAAITLGFFGAYYLRLLMQPLFVHDLYPVGWYGFFILFYHLVFLLTFFAAGLYRVRRETPVAEELGRIARAVALGIVILMAATYVSRVRVYSRAVVVGQGVIAVLAASLFRRGIRALHRELVRARFDLRRVAIVGTRAEALALSERFAASPELGIEVVGFLNESGEGLGPVGELPSIVERFTIQEVIIGESHGAKRSLLPFLAHSRRRHIQITVVSPLARFLGARARVEEIAGVPVFSMERRAFFRLERGAKRCGDALAAIVALPIAAIASAIDRLCGTIAAPARRFSETRRGREGRPLAWPRVVRPSGREAGDFAKPGLWLSLLTGRLSLVGPPALAEPAPPELAGALERVRPGITGRWRMARDASVREALEREALGLESWSMTEDVFILVESIGRLWSGTYPAWFHRKGDAP